jgi:NitT/TauT family transport system permease protein
MTATTATATSAAAVHTPSMGDRAARGVRQVLPLVITLIVLALCWEGYKALGQAWDDEVPGLGWGFPVATDDVRMPHITSIVSALGEETQVGRELLPLWRVLLDGAIFTAREAAAGLIVGTILGVAIAVVFQTVPLLQRALLPWIVITQTIPFVATAPMIVIWGGRNGWDPWIPVAMLSAYLAFFPVTINVLRGLNAPSEEHLELMRSVAANRREVLVRLRFPAALPYLFSGLRLAAAAAVVGAVVGELPSGQGEGLGRLLLTFTSFFNLAPERLFAAVAAAAALGLFFVGLVALIERVVLGPSRKELT